LVIKLECAWPVYFYKAQCFHITTTMITKIRKSFEVFFKRIIWNFTMEKVLATSNFTFVHMNENLVNRILIKCTSVH
jgi:hypothetical protein